MLTWLILGGILAPILLFALLMILAARTFRPEDESDWPTYT